MSPTLNGSSAIQCFEVSVAIEIPDEITFDFYTGLSHICVYVEDEQMVNCSSTKSHAQAAHKEEGLVTLGAFLWLC